MLTKTALATLYATMAVAMDVPRPGDYKLEWWDEFWGDAGRAADSNNWNVLDRARRDNGNNEWQDYTSSNLNVQMSGGNTLQIFPVWRDNRWTSGRLESKYTFTPLDGHVTAVEARIRFGTGGGKAGIWPAFWMLGDMCRTGGAGWPSCGEVDAMEMVNDQLVGYGTLHCDHTGGGRCEEPIGLQGHTDIPDYGWHTWRVEWDRRQGNWRDQEMHWFIDGRHFHSVKGSRIDDLGIWQRLTASKLFFILNVAVGGDWVSHLILSYIIVTLLTLLLSTLIAS
jgi:beta-glucanase (GH16 family)